IFACLTASCTLEMSLSNPNSGVWTPITSRPSSLYFSYNALMCGCAFWQLKQLYVQNSTSTTFSPTASLIDTPSVLIRPVEPVISLALGYSSSLPALRSASKTSCFSPVPRSGEPDLPASPDVPEAVCTFFLPETPVSPLVLLALCGPPLGCLFALDFAPAV